ncbi:DUF2871 domain-containing protein [Agromyces intestinalis]|uniref:DUF2871 domain-containing protein n=1 Tax=Agromyces intestinalis TaxID=2592652 RepID=A0A5C1YF39_9MICO|nr:DUF2871 domain-containing protein [Agromyces intestinalis]QEO14693.1 DUF2871 domain-containing protein [Agromyces intestinalis]
MRRLFIAACVYLAAGLAGGLFHREFTKLTGFPEGGATQLAVVHTHLLTLGFLAMLLFLVLERVFALSRSRLFGWFFWTYNAGLVLTAGMLALHGSLTVLGLESSKAIAGIAGTGHLLLGVGTALLLVALGKRLRADRIASADAPLSAASDAPLSAAR